MRECMLPGHPGAPACGLDCEEQAIDRGARRSHWDTPAVQHVRSELAAMQPWERRMAVADTVRAILRECVESLEAHEREGRASLSPLGALLGAVEYEARGASHHDEARELGERMLALSARARVAREAA